MSVCEKGYLTERVCLFFEYAGRHQIRSQQTLRSFAKWRFEGRMRGLRFHIYRGIGGNADSRFETWWNLRLSETLHGQQAFEYPSAIHA